MKIIQGFPSSNRERKDSYVFICGDNWERLPWEEVDKGFIRVRRSWGTPSSFGVCVCVAFLYVLLVLSYFFPYRFFIWFMDLLFTAIACLLLSLVWKDRISRILGIKNHHYTAFIQPNLLASCSFGPESNKIVKALVQANQRRT